jgi:hypothetical protein
MDAAYYEDLVGRLYGLLITLEDRLGEQTRLLHHFIEVDEYELALEEIAGALAQHALAITDQEREDMLALARQMNQGQRPGAPRAEVLPCHARPQWFRRRSWKRRLRITARAGLRPRRRSPPSRPGCRRQRHARCPTRWPGHRRRRRPDGHRDRHRDVVSTSAVLRGDLGRGDGRVNRIGQGTLEVCAGGSQARQPLRRGTSSRTRCASSPWLAVPLGTTS